MLTSPSFEQLPENADAHPVRLAFRVGELCPQCGKGVLDYNGLLDLECPFCGYSQGSALGCT
jgi:uncharacterized protein (DUF983 family)